MDNFCIVFSHVSDDRRIDVFKPIAEQYMRDNFFWFDDRYHNHFSMKDYRASYFHLFVKNPRRDGNGFDSMQGTDGDFDLLYRYFLDYQARREAGYFKGNLMSRQGAAPILRSSSTIVPDLIARAEANRGDYYVLKPDNYAGRGLCLFTADNYPRRFDEIPELVEILPQLRLAYPLIEPPLVDGRYHYPDWVQQEPNQFLVDPPKYGLREEARDWVDHLKAVARGLLRRE